MHDSFVRWLVLTPSLNVLPGVDSIKILYLHGLYPQLVPKAMTDTVPTTLTYFQPPKDGSRAWILTDADPVTGKRSSNYELEQKEVNIENIRGKEDRYSLDTSGFQYFTHAAAHKKFTDTEEIKMEYYPESIELIKKLTGAHRVVLFDHSMCLKIMLVYGGTPSSS